MVSQIVKIFKIPAAVGEPTHFKKFRTPGLIAAWMILGIPHIISRRSVILRKTGPLISSKKPIFSIWISMPYRQQDWNLKRKKTGTTVYSEIDKWDDATFWISQNNSYSHFFIGKTRVSTFFTAGSGANHLETGHRPKSLWTFWNTSFPQHQWSP